MLHDYKLIPPQNISQFRYIITGITRKVEYLKINDFTGISFEINSNLPTLKNTILDQFNMQMTGNRQRLRCYIILKRLVRKQQSYLKLCHSH